MLRNCRSRKQHLGAGSLDRQHGKSLQNSLNRDLDKDIAM